MSPQSESTTSSSRCCSSHGDDQSARVDIVAITPNPAVDVTITVDALVDEATHRIDTAERRLGGKGFNVATVAASQGYPVAAVGPVSSTSYALLEQRGLDFPESLVCELTDTPVPLRETWAIHRTGDNATVIINESGAEHPGSVWDGVVATTSRLTAAGAQVVTISGSWPKGTDESTLARLIDAAGSARVIVDCAGANLVAACRAGAVVKPNAAEIFETTGISNPIEGARQLLSYGSELVVVSMGPDGLAAVTTDKVVTAKLPAPLDGNPTGAGDSLVAALATSIIDGLELEDMLVRAVAWSAAAVLVPYAGAIDASWPSLRGQVIVATQ